MYLCQCTCVSVPVSVYLYQCTCFSVPVLVYLSQCTCVSALVSAYLCQCTCVSVLVQWTPEMGSNANAFAFKCILNACKSICICIWTFQIKSICICIWKFFQILFKYFWNKFEIFFLFYKLTRIGLKFGEYNFLSYYSHCV